MNCLAMLRTGCGGGLPGGGRGRRQVIQEALRFLAELRAGPGRPGHLAHVPCGFVHLVQPGIDAA